MLVLKAFEKKNKNGFAAMTADELKFINGGASSCGSPSYDHRPPKGPKY